MQVGLDLLGNRLNDARLMLSCYHLFFHAYLPSGYLNTSPLGLSILFFPMDRSMSSGPSGLIPYGDYVVGWTEGALHAESDFYDLVEHVSSIRSSRFTFRACPVASEYVAYQGS